tara:strand:- start:530 stop:1090 length:561 start_codon:yes stop_codon:yes gene_type:complete
MKVAISGSAGTGKTTLARALAEQWGCVLVEEGYDDFFDERYNYIQSRSELKRRIVSLLESKHRLEQEQESFVVDRCPVDLFNLWMAQGFGDDQKSTGALYSQCRKYIEKYDRVIVLPWSAIPLKQLEHSESRRRTMNCWHQLYNHANIIGLLHQWVVPAKLLPMPFNASTLTERVDFVCKAMDCGA